MPTKIKALLIDMDGTLIDTLPLLFNVYKNFLEKRGVSGTQKEFSELNGPSIQEVLHILQQRYEFEGNSEKFLKEYQAELSLHYSQEVSLFTHAKETLVHAKAQGLKIALVSSAAKTLVEAFVKAQQLTDMFDALITPEGLVKSKPAPDIYIRAIKTLNILPLEALAIEDSENGVQSAVDAGILTLWITHQKNIPNLRKTSLCIQVSDWTAIDQFLKEINA